jgi:hypothetical protein
MASTNFIDQQTVIFADWLNDANNAVYNGIFVSPSITATSMICNGTASGAGFTNLINNVFSAPGPIGSATPNTGAFTALTSTSLTTNAISGSSPLTIRGSTSGTVGLAVPAVAGTNTITLPAVTGTAVISGQNSALTLGTSQATTSGNTVTFSSIPSWVKRITIIFNAVSTNGTGIPQMVIQIGSGSLVTTGYTSVCTTTGNGTSIQSFTDGFAVRGDQNAAAIVTGTMTLTKFNNSSNTWIESGVSAQTVSPYIFSSAGLLTLSGTLDRLALVTTDTFDAGSINILYE